MWLFGRKRDDIDPTRCAECGRTLLDGEWTQRVVDDDGRELLICSLCSQSYSRGPLAAASQVPTAGDASWATTTGRETQRRSDAVWRALKEKEAEIADLRARLARSEAERDELADKLARTRDEEETAASLAAGELADDRPETAGVAEVAIADAAVADAAVADAAGDAAVRDPTDAGEKTEDWPQPIAGAGEGERASAEPGSELEDTLAGTMPGEQATAGVVAVAAGGAAAAATDEADLEQGRDERDEGYLSDEELHLLQRGVDVLNVSNVPKKVAETSASLGVPFVHVTAEPDGDVSVTFMWPLGWYRYSVVLEGAGRVALAERGYEDLPDVQPNCTVRADGTVQLAPAFGRRPTPKEETAADTEPSVTTASVTSGVIISKSLLGQRTDDETVGTWEKQNPRDLDWGR